MFRLRDTSAAVKKRGRDGRDMRVEGPEQASVLGLELKVEV